ncbi:transposase family protein (plasmid) [Cylindrospermum stagnale PCC 7417]|uniref:Transposase family protein n=1 Tax=Cylindrospermum stagnale PCC 7417 TaxID=56107 RepID=K9X726_9NOST|nr:ISL3 family transposase [Cylindrospermum stagnale]AFZ28293.1 transposase family protein [Cylindrospermum stagnale PCC 7417]
MSVLTHLLPDSTNLKLENCQVDKIKTQIKLIVSAIRTVVNCPVCNQPTHKIHSRYERKLTDLPWADYSITLQLRVRKFYCINTLCKRRIFTERLTSVTAPWARRTLRLAQRLSAIGLANGGEAGVRLSEQLGLTVSRNTLLKLVRSIPLPPIVTPQTLGVDDFCFRKCKTYGTALIDLERSRPIALLKDAKAEILAEWLKAHPGVKVVSRDRSKTYESGIRQGAPEAIHVADRFHLLQNLAETLNQVFATNHQALKAVDEAYSLSSVIQTDGTVVVRVPRPSREQQALQLTERNHARRLAIHQQVWDLHDQGWSAKAIACQVGIGVTSVFRYLRTPTFPEPTRRRSRGRSILVPYQEYILKRWDEGCYEGLALFEEIQKLGYKGSYDTVARYTRRIRTVQGIKPRKRYSVKSLPKVTQPKKLCLTPRRAVWLVLRNPDSQQPEDEELIALLIGQHPDLAEAIKLAQGFAQIVRQRLPQQLQRWLTVAESSNLTAFHRFAKRLREDYDAVKAGVTMSVSNGPVEGHINRLKMLKRQMYGRAKIDLLERRFLLAI